MNSDKTDFICLVLSNSWQRFNMPVNLPEWCSHPYLYRSHLFYRGPVIQSAHFCTSNPTSVSPLFLLLAVDPDSEAVSEVLNTDSAKALLHALIASRLDYCNSVLYRINTRAAKTLHSFLHSATRLIIRKRKFDSITPTLRDDLHWLPVSQRI